MLPIVGLGTLGIGLTKMRSKTNEEAKKSEGTTEELLRELGAKVVRNRGFANFYRNKGLRLVEHNRKLEALLEAAKEALYLDDWE